MKEINDTIVYFEIWEQLKYEGIKDMYEISNSGRVKNKLTGRIIAETTSEKGYTMVSIMGTDGKQKTKKLHRLVAFTFLYNDNFWNLTVNHKNGNKDDNSVFNLELVTFQENIIHSFKTGLNKPKLGSDNPSAKHDESEIHNILSLIENGKSNKEIKLILKKNYNRYFLHDLRRKKTWRHLSKEYNI